jgi:septal ring factor EnvC (AmiA/AmiB activator)
MKAFDTYTHINDLKKVGFREEQAAVIIRSLMDSREMDLANLATKEQVANIERNMVTREDLAEVIAEVKAELKGDISELRTELKGDIADLRTELKGDIADLRTELAELRTETKKDIADLRTELAELRTETKKDIAGLRTEITGVKDMIKDLQINLVKWIVGLMIAFTGIILAGIQLLKI